ncbi:alkylation response protein AidB-like acyl-CoA dehydrogenase [Panacagrimonas perspica]|uniref:Alkylation response protein AidB-like acyl-CoA dehydrogenase n=1 Tax=Panacagrimonas perspica TaxID=381431 RepID=A0A4R7PD09_9GAMM|nr:acyl-CoA dehydrogenase [Panacagrimonas perspica]TDU31140.1 alkylation response protein AidB-like acyl-CoA dehydrogenase [Panacagrimonas perspica]THD01727.1 hypothetical protein B1810_17070 [Panacagrimonas perspica]
MTFALGEDQILIRDAAADFLADASDSTAVRRAMDSEQGYDDATWQRIAQELGWCALAVGEAHGGLGLGAVESMLLFEQAGRRLLCAPLFATAGLAIPLLSQIAELSSSSAASQALGDIARGATRFGVSLPSQPDWTVTAVTAERESGRWRVDGELPAVVDGASCDQLLFFAIVNGEKCGLFMAPRDAEGVVTQALEGWDRGRRFSRVRFEQVRSAQRLDADGVAPAALRRATALARLNLAAEQLGSAQACLDMTVDYVSTRKQFGRPIAGFQAVKHRCAEMMVRVEALRSAVHGAAVTADAAANDDGTELELACAAARASASDTAFWCAQEAIQLHGGVGFTWEYDPQLHFKRAQAAVGWLGRPDALREHIASTLLDEGEAPSLPKPEGFRAEVAGWMQAHLTGRFETLRHRGGPGDEEFEPALRKEWERELAAGGWTCVGWPAEAGGRALSIDQQVIFHEEYARAGGPGRMGHIGEGLIGPALIHFGSAEQKAQFLPEIVAGRCFWAQGYSEPNAGSDLANVQTHCWQEADGSWRVQGQKIWTSLAHESDWIFVLARCEPGSKGNKGLAFLLMPLRQPGIEIRPIRQMGGGAEFNEVFFDGALAEAQHLVGQPGDGWKVAMGLLEVERGVSTLGQQMHFAHELERIIAAARRNGTARDPVIRQRIASASIGLRVMRANALRMLADGAEVGLRREALIYKYYWSNWHRDLGKLAMDVLGEEGAVVSQDPAIRSLQQMFFFSRSDTIYAGTNEIQLNLIAERGLGMPREARPASP